MTPCTCSGCALKCTSMTPCSCSGSKTSPVVQLYLCARSLSPSQALSFSQQLGPSLPACQSRSFVKHLRQRLLASFITLSRFFFFQVFLPFSTLLLLSHSHIVPSRLPRRDICCCLHGTPAGSEPRRRSVPVATSSVLRTPLDHSGTSVYRPIGALVCEPPKGQVAPDE